MNKFAQKLFLPNDSVITELNEDYSAVINPYMQKPVVVLHKRLVKILNFCRNKNGVTLNDLKTTFSSFKNLEKSIKKLIDVQVLFNTPNPKLKFSSSKELSVWMHITNDCNLRCRYCYVKKTKQAMSEKIAKKTVETVFKSAIKHHFNTVKFKLSGGEALLKLDLIEKVHYWASNLAKQNNIEVKFVVLSNGTIINEKIIKKLKKMKMEVMISLDGLESYHDKQRIFADGRGSFKFVEKSISLIKKHELPYYISITISDENIEGLTALTKYLLDRELLSFSFNFYRENPCSIEDSKLKLNEARMFRHLQESFKIIEKRLPKLSLLNVLSDRTYLGFPHSKTCGVGSNYLVVDHLGKISKCQMEMDKKITTIEDDDPISKIRNSAIGIQNLPVSKKTPCKTCPWRHFCTGGCPLFTFRSTGKYDLKSPNCELYKQLFPEIVKLEGLRLLKYGG